MSKGGKKADIVPKKDDEAFDMEVIEDVLEDSIEELPPAVQRRVNALKNLHKEHVTLEKKYRDEVAALDLKYEKLYAPLYAKQGTIVNGEYEPTDAEAHFEEEDKAAAASDKIDEDIKGIPKFWLNVLKNNINIADSITENDEDALSYLTDIRCSHFDDAKGFEITFHFAENPYFESDSEKKEVVLSKKYFLADDDNLYGELVFDRAEGTTIKWKQGKNLTVRLIKERTKAKGGKGKKGGATRVNVVETPIDSFFHFFNTTKLEEQDEEEEGLDNLLEQDFEIGCIIKDKLVPHAVLWFTKEALEYEDDYEDYDDFPFDDEGEEGEEEEEEEEEEEKPRKGRKKGGDGGKGFQLQPPSSQKGAPAQPQQPECKQQ